ncbi:hypothetical protein Q7C36_012260 [Tachysurus vachellii]|uniref:Uncharacterized protein n=1 Tax=Tachysurus vachellii TaxID=175792 RepID=A0AA88MQR0_TACVA|nr:hypothetical protein Q7C36_012260 [Tachysurus vachellii]
MTHSGCGTETENTLENDWKVHRPQLSSVCCEKKRIIKRDPSSQSAGDVVSSPEARFSLSCSHMRRASPSEVVFGLARTEERH